MTTTFRTPLDHLGPSLLPSGNVAVTTVQLSTNNTRVAWVFQAETASQITTVGFKLNTITDGGSMPTYRLSLQGVDGAGLPDGTIKGVSNSAFVTFTPTTGNGYANGTFTWIALGTAYTPANIGEILALVIDVSSGTASGTNKISIDQGLQNVAGYSTGVPYTLTDTNLTWAAGDKVASSDPVFGYKTSGDVFGLPVESVTSATISSTTEVALRFTLPAGFGTSFQILGALWNCAVAANAGRLYRLSLYSGGESAPSLLEQIEMDSDWHDTPGSSGTDRYLRTLFDDAASTLTFGTQYHLGLALDSGSTLTLRVYQFAAAGDMKALPWGDSAFCLASRTITYPPATGGNVFASSATQLKQRPILLPILSDWTVPVASSGIIAPRIFTGF